MRRRSALLACAAAALAVLGCASTGLVGSDLERSLRERGVDPVTVVIPFEITDEIRAWAHAHVPSGTPKEERLDRLLAAMIGQMQLKYEAGRTATAREAFEVRRANCLAFTSLFVGMARELGIPAFYLNVEDVERFEKDGDLMVVSGHVSAGYDIGGSRLKILDFTPAQDRLGYRRVHPITDLRAVAVFYSNRGAEALRAGNAVEALGWLRKGVEIDPETSSAYSNLASILRMRGRNAEAEKLLALATHADNRNPFSYIALGDLSLAQGRLKEAQRFYRRALRPPPQGAAAYAALGLVGLAAGGP